MPLWVPSMFVSLFGLCTVISGILTVFVPIQVISLHESVVWAITSGQSISQHNSHLNEKKCILFLAYIEG